MTSSYWALWDVPYWQIMHQAAPLIVAINIFRWICCTKCCWILLFFVQRHFACLDDAYLFPALILQELHLNKLNRSVVVCNAAVSACEKGALGYKSWKWKKLPVLRIFLVFCSNIWWCEAFFGKNGCHFKLKMKWPESLMDSAGCSSFCMPGSQWSHVLHLMFEMLCHQLEACLMGTQI